MSDLKKYRWNLIEANLSKVFGDNTIKMSDSGTQALVCKGDTVMAIVKIYDDENSVSVHLRASLLPIASGYICATLGKVMPIIIDEMFEYDYDGKMLAGSDAIDFASKNIKDLWYGFKEKKTGEKHKRPKFLS